MAHDSSDRTIALGAIYQAIDCVTRIAQQGSTDFAVMEPCIYSLFQVDAENVDAVFGEPGAVAYGMRRLIAQLSGQGERDLEMTRYVVRLVRLERALSARPDLLAIVSEGIERARIKREHFNLTHPNLLAHFAELYSATISQLTPKIMVHGKPLHLHDPDNQNRIRALLLAGIRGAMLWRQLGGSRWQFLFKGRQILDDATRYLDRYGERD